MLDGISPVREEAPRGELRLSSEEAGPTSAAPQHDRVEARGKFLFAGRRKLVARGVTYGPFAPGPDGSEYPAPSTVSRDFATMAMAGINSVRTYTVPPRWLLDVASHWGLRVLIGLPWEQHVTFLDDAAVRRRILRTVRAGVRACAGHSAVLAYAIGNEIPAGIVRWHGPAAVEGFIRRLYELSKAEDREALVTYVNYPSTEYLDLPFLDFLSFNVYLEDQERLEAYLARLQNVAGDRPLVMAEVGLDSDRNGLEQQAKTLDWQVRTVLRNGCAGTFVFAWSDEWFRGGSVIDDWAFGITDRDRRPKPAFAAVRHAFGASLIDPWDCPHISVVICTYNGNATIRDCLDAVSRLDYPSYEVIVVNDGSTDNTGDIVDAYDLRQIRIPNGGLSNARNVGYRAARGDIVAYIDDDAFPDPHWLTFLALAFQRSRHAGIGGPNIPPPDAGVVADGVANSPGGPSHVLSSDREAEHIPGCNMAFRREALEEVDGFDPRFRAAGDDVDLCWRLLESGHTLGYEAGAMVWHHRRGSVKAYLKQQLGYGKAEAMLELKWPEKYNRLGHPRWSGQLYGRGHTLPLPWRSRRVEHGVWGSGLFQRMYAGDSGPASYVTLMPEWYLVILGLAALSLVGILWTPLLLALPLFVGAVGVTLVQAVLSARRAKFNGPSLERAGPWRMRLLTAALHVLQPLARLSGRLAYRLTPWRLHGARGHALPVPRTLRIWSESWRDPSAWIATFEQLLKRHRVLVRCGGSSDRWDLQAECGLLGGVRLLGAVEEHGGGRQQVVLTARPRFFATALTLGPLLASLAVLAGWDGAVAACILLALAALLVVLRSFRECSMAMYSVRLTVDELRKACSP